MPEAGFMNSFDDAKESGAVGDVAVLATAAAVTALLLSGASGYRNAVDPTKGMPKWKVGLDTAVAAAGIGGALLLDGAPAMASLGSGIAGLCSVVSQYGTVGGGYVAMLMGKAAPQSPESPAANPSAPATPATPAVKGNASNGNEIHEGGMGSMTAKQKARYEAYVGR